jgi:hypothetical protein
LAQDKPWPTPISAHDPSFDFESAIALSIEKEEKFGHLDSGEIGRGLFSDSPLTTPEPTPPPSPTQKPNSLDDPNLPPFPPDPQSVPGETASISAGRLENAGKKYGSNKKRSHAKRKRDRAERRKEREAGAHPYNVRPATRQKLHNSNLKAIDAKLDLTDISISAPGYIGLRDAEELKDKTAYRLDDLVGENSRFKFKLQKWDGR